MAANFMTAPRFLRRPARIPEGGPGDAPLLGAGLAEQLPEEHERPNDEQGDRNRRNYQGDEAGPMAGRLLRLPVHP